MSFAPKNSKPTSPALRQQASSRKLSIGSSASSPGDGRKKSQEFLESDGLLEAKNAEIEALKQRIEKYDADQKKLGPYMAEVRRGQAENDRMKKEVHELKMKLAEVEHIKERAAEIESERRGFERQRKGLENEIEILRSRCERAENEQAEELEKFFEKLREEEKRNNALEERMSRQAREMEDKLVKAAQFEADESLAQEIESLRSRNLELEQQQKHHDEKVYFLERENEKIEARLQDSENERIESSRLNHESEVTLRRELAETKRGLDLANHAIVQMKDQLKEGELEEASFRVMRSSEDILKTVEERSEKERLRMESLRKECADLEATRSSLQSDIACAKKALALEEKELREKRAQSMSDMMTEVERKRQELMKDLDVEINSSREQARMLVQRASIKAESRPDGGEAPGTGGSTGQDVSYVQTIELQVRCEQLTNENRSLRKESERLRILTADLESVRFSFAGENKRYVSRIKELDGELARMKEIHVETIREKKAADDDRMELEARLDRMAAQRTELSAQVDELINEIQTLKMKRQIENEGVSVMEKKLQENAEAQDKLQKLCDAQKEELSSFRAVVSNRIEKLFAHCNEHGDPSGFSSDIIARSGAGSIGVEGVLDLYDRELTALASKCRRQSQDLEKLENDKSRLSQELDALRANIATQSRTAAAELDNNRLRQEIDNLREGLNGTGAGIKGHVAMNKWTEHPPESTVASSPLTKSPKYPLDTSKPHNRYSNLAAAKRYRGLAKVNSYYDYSRGGMVPGLLEGDIEARIYTKKADEPAYVDRLLAKAISMNENMQHLVRHNGSPSGSHFGSGYRSSMNAWQDGPSYHSPGGTHPYSIPGPQANISPSSPGRTEWASASPSLHTPIKW